MNNRAVLEINNLSKTFMDAGKPISVWNGLSLRVMPQEQVAIVGRSGCGKSTLLQCMGLLEQPSSGDIFFEGKRVNKLPEHQREKIRNESIGFVFQHHHLLNDFSALENVMMPLWIQGGLDQSTAFAKSLLIEMGLGGRLEHRPGQLSGGERQRVAIARALVNRPKIILADEPTGNLDANSAELVWMQLQTAVKNQGAALILVTHDKGLADRLDRREVMS